MVPVVSCLTQSQSQMQEAEWCDQQPGGGAGQGDAGMQLDRQAACARQKALKVNTRDTTELSS